MGLLRKFQKHLLERARKKKQDKHDIQKEKEKISALEAGVLQSKETMKYLDRFKEWKKSTDLDKKSVDTPLSDIIGPKDKFMVVMFTRANECEMFYASTEKQYFDYHESNYFIDPHAMTFVKTVKSWMSFYHQNSALPMQFTDGLKELMNKINRGEVQTEVNLTIDSKVFERYIKSEFVQKMMTGAQLMNEFFFLKFMLVVLAIIALLGFIISIITLIMVAK